MLFKDRKLNIAILISVSWHIVFILSITPVFTSANINKNNISISFLGSILERLEAVSEKPIILEKLTLLEKIEKRHNIPSAKYALRSPEPTLKVFEALPDKGSFVFSEDRYKNVSFRKLYENEEKTKIKFKDVLLRSAAKNRLVLYRPELSTALVLSLHFGSEYNVSIRFKISRHGFVKRPECIESSGSSEIDESAIRYIRRWQFVPSDEAFSADQEGIVRIRFTGV